MTTGLVIRFELHHVVEEVLLGINIETSLINLNSV